MSLPYHDVRAHKQQDDIGEPYRDAHERVAQSEATVRNQARGHQENQPNESDDDRRDRLECEASERLKVVQDEVRSREG